jgi:hypothetical protein
MEREGRRRKKGKKVRRRERKRRKKGRVVR